jgi:hypothetical protein
MMMHVGELMVMLHGYRTGVSSGGPMADGRVFSAGEARIGVPYAAKATGTASSDARSMAAVSMITA